MVNSAGTVRETKALAKKFVDIKKVQNCTVWCKLHSRIQFS